MELNSTQRKIVDSLRDLSLPPGARILELGMGRGGHTIPLRAAYPEAWITGYDLAKFQVGGKPAWNTPAVDLVSEERYEDITRVVREEDRDSYDLVTLGNYRGAVSSLFALPTEDSYRAVLTSLAYYLRPGGILALVLKTFTCSTPAQTSLHNRREFKRPLYADPPTKLNRFQRNRDIIPVTLKILESLGLHRAESRDFSDDVPIEPGSNWAEDCRTFLRKKGEDSQDLLAEAARFDEAAARTGLHFGWFAMVSAEKSIS